MTTVPTTRSAEALAPGDIITIHPDHPQRAGEWTVAAMPQTLLHLGDGGEWTPAGKVAIDYTTRDGGEGRMVVPSRARIVIQGPELTDREAIVAGLRQLADWLERNPDMPLGLYPDVELKVFVREDSEAASAAEVERIADLIGVQPRHNGRHYHATKTFGPASYDVVACDVRPTADQKAQVSA